jgi:hypothetical protein
MSDPGKTQTPEGEAVTWGAIAALLAGLLTFWAVRYHVWLFYPFFRQIVIWGLSVAPHWAIWRMPRAPEICGAAAVAFIVFVPACVLCFLLFGDFAQRVERRAARHGEQRELMRRRRKERRDFDVS